MGECAIIDWSQFLAKSPDGKIRITDFADMNFIHIFDSVEDASAYLAGNHKLGANS